MGKDAHPTKLEFKKFWLIAQNLARFHTSARLENLVTKANLTKQIQDLSPNTAFNINSKAKSSANLNSKTNSNADLKSNSNENLQIHTMNFIKSKYAITALCQK